MNNDEAVRKPIDEAVRKAVQAEHRSDNELICRVEQTTRAFTETLKTGLCPVPLNKLRERSDNVRHAVYAILAKYQGHPAASARRGDHRTWWPESAADPQAVKAAFDKGAREVKGVGLTCSTPADALPKDKSQQITGSCTDKEPRTVKERTHLGHEFHWGVCKWCDCDDTGDERGEKKCKGADAPPPLNVPFSALQELHDCIDGTPGHDKFLLNVAVATAIHTLNNHTGERYRRVMDLAAHLHDFDVWNEADRRALKEEVDDNARMADLEHQLAWKNKLLRDLDTLLHTDGHWPDLCHAVRKLKG